MVEKSRAEIVRGKKPGVAGEERNAWREIFISIFDFANEKKLGRRLTLCFKILGNMDRISLMKSFFFFSAIRLNSISQKKGIFFLRSFIFHHPK